MVTDEDGPALVRCVDAVDLDGHTYRIAGSYGDHAVVLIDTPPEAAPATCAPLAALVDASRRH